MTLNPGESKAWHGFLDLLQPPAGYRMAAALGTTFGLSLEALVAALLSMCDADGEELARDPVAATMAVTRLSGRVRVLVHPATTTGPRQNSGTDRFLALLDRLIVEVQPESGLFHPKVWALRFDHVGAPKPGVARQIGRVIVGSRNLTDSTSFELGGVFEGRPNDGEEPDPFAEDVSGALRQWLEKGPRIPDAVWRLPEFIAGLGFERPREAEQALRLMRQGNARESLFSRLPARSKQALVVSPFVRPAFVQELLKRTESLQLISSSESLDQLDDDTVSALWARGRAQGMPALYHITEHGDPDDARIEGLHAKMIILEDPKQRTTWLGSANATGPGWGLPGTANVEAVLEMRPGIGLAQFSREFVADKGQPHPWIEEYSRLIRTEPDPQLEAERSMLAALREVASRPLVVRYDEASERLTLLRGGRSSRGAWAESQERQFFVAPFLLASREDSWRPLEELETSGCVFHNVPLDHVSAFVLLRGRSVEPAVEKQRLVVATLDVSSDMLDRRDQAVRTAILSSADPATVLSALVRGLSFLRVGSAGEKAGGRSSRQGVSALLEETTLERLLQAVAVEPGLVKEMRLLLGHAGGEILKLCDQLDEAIRRIVEEATS